MSTAIAREVPCKRSVQVENTTEGSKQTLPTYIMTMTLKEAYEMFKAEYPETKISFTSFRKMKPNRVRRISDTNRRTCLCQMCCNLALKLEGLKKIAVIDTTQFNTKKQLADMTVCPYEDVPAWKCITRECNLCGPSLQSLYKEEIQANKDLKVTWAKWEYVTLASDAENQGGLKKRVLSCVAKETTLPLFVTECDLDLVGYPRHLFEASWQQKQLNACLAHVTTSNIAVVMDYSENYRVAYQNEAQSAFFDPIQTTIHPMMHFYRNQENTLVKHAIIGISDDGKHDPSGVALFVKSALEVLEKKHGLKITSIHQWTDGCASQYKGKNAFFDMTKTSLPLSHIIFARKIVKSASFHGLPFLINH